MADSLKRTTKAKDPQFQDRVRYYLYQHALSVFAEETPDADDLAYAKKVYAGEVDLFNMALVLMANTSIGSSVDAGAEVAEGDILWAITTDGQFHNMAVSDAVGA